VRPLPTQYVKQRPTLRTSCARGRRKGEVAWT
jgi:hypothetical protein